jgi:hypothetical protein
MKLAEFDTQQCAALCENWKNEAYTAAGGMKADPNVLAHIGQVRLGFHISGGATVYFTLETEVIRNSSQDDLAEALFNEILAVASPKH